MADQFVSSHEIDLIEGQALWQERLILESGELFFPNSFDDLEGFYLEHMELQLPIERRRLVPVKYNGPLEYWSAPLNFHDEEIE